MKGGGGRIQYSEGLGTRGGYAVQIQDRPLSAEFLVHCQLFFGCFLLLRARPHPTTRVLPLEPMEAIIGKHWRKKTPHTRRISRNY